MADSIWQQGSYPPNTEEKPTYEKKCEWDL